LQAVQALNLDAGIDPQDLNHDPGLLMDPSHLTAAVLNSPIPLDANCQAILNGYKDGLQVGQSLTTTLQVIKTGYHSWSVYAKKIFFRLVLRSSWNKKISFFV
jgi:hypothetical protein